MSSFAVTLICLQCKARIAAPPTLPVICPRCGGDTVKEVVPPGEQRKEASSTIVDMDTFRPILLAAVTRAQILMARDQADGVPVYVAAMAYCVVLMGMEEGHEWKAAELLEIIKRITEATVKQSGT